MKNPGTFHVLRDGARVLRFEGDLLAAASSKRPGAPRWSEIVLYRLSTGGYMVGKTGFSAVVHDPSCKRVRRDMPTWMDLPKSDREDVPYRVGCEECAPDVASAMMDAQLRVERTRHQAFVVPDPVSLVEMLTEGRDTVPTLIKRVLDSARDVDPALEATWSPSSS